MTIQIREAAGKAGTLSGSRMEITLITPGWGSSGYYSPEVLEKAAENLVFPRKTQMHIDHDKEGGVGSVATLAAYLNEDARWEPDWLDPDTGVKGRLVAEAKVNSKWGPILADVAEAIGTSIAAPAEISMGEAEGRQGKIIESLLPGKLNRVDFVTVAGRGGRISEVLESYEEQAAEEIVQKAVASGVEEATANEVRELLSTALRAANPGDRVYVWMRDYDPVHVWYELENQTGSGLYQETYTLNGSTVTLSGSPVPVRIQTSYVPIAAESAAPDSPPNPAGVAKGKEPTVGQIQIEESVHADLVANASRVTALEAAEATAKEALAETNTAAAAALVKAALEAVGINAPKTAARLSAGFPVKENGAIDVEKFSAEITESIAELQVSGGAGTPRGLGDGTTPPPSEGTKVELSTEDAHKAILAQAGYTPKGA